MLCGRFLAFWGILFRIFWLGGLVLGWTGVWDGLGRQGREHKVSCSLSQVGWPLCTTFPLSSSQVQFPPFLNPPPHPLQPRLPASNHPVKRIADRALCYKSRACLPNINILLSLLPPHPTLHQPPHPSAAPPTVDICPCLSVFAAVFSHSILRICLPSPPYQSRISGTVINNRYKASPWK